MIKKLASHLGEYKRSAIVTPLLSALEAIMDILLPTIMSFIRHRNTCTCADNRRKRTGRIILCI